MFCMNYLCLGKPFIVFFLILFLQASPIAIGGRQAVVEIKRTTARGNLKLTKINVIHRCALF